MSLYDSELNTLVNYYLVREFVEHGIDRMCIKEFLPLAAALVYPFKDAKILHGNIPSGSVMPIIDSVKKFASRKTGLEKYSLEGLRRFLQHKWLPTLEFNVQAKLIKGISLVDSVEDNGYFSIKGNEKTYDSYLHRIQVLDISEKYGNDNYETSIENQPVDEDVISPHNSSSDDNPEVNENNPETASLESLKEFLLKYFPFDKYPDGLATHTYFWQYKVDNAQYNILKERLALFFRGKINKKLLETKISEYGTVAHVLALYISEWYKREYKGNDSNNAFKTIGIDSYNNIPQSICKIIDKEAYKTNVNETEVGNHVWLNTLYVDGGLPIHYISTQLDNNKTNYFIDGLSKLLDPEDDIDRMVGEDLLEKGSNTATRESYHNYHSIYKYIQVLNGDEEPWHDSDNTNEEFRDFKEKVRNAKRKAQERKKFKIFYSLWTFLDNSNIKEFYITPQLRFNPEEDGERHYAISKQRLENWGIKNPPAQFSLIVGDTNLIFTICYNGDYISRGLVDRIDLPILDKNLKIEDLSNPDYTIIYDDLKNEPCSLRKDFYLPFKDGYMQLYTDDDPSMSSWNSYKGAQSFRWSGILYDKNRYQLLSQNTIIDINEQIGWVTFADSVTFEDTIKGKIRTFFNSKGSIYAKPATQCMHDIIKSSCLLEGCILDGQAECTMGDEQGKAYIVKSTGITFDVFRAENDEKEDVSTAVVYKSASCYRDSSAQWQEYDSKKTKLDQGLYVFRLSRGRYMTEVRCYVLPHDANISFYNGSQPYKIMFKSFINVKSEGIVKNKQGDFNISDNRDNFTFSIGADDGYITLKTYHPKAQTHLYLHGQEITNKPILMAYAEDIEVNHISSSNKPKCRLSDYTKAYKRLFDALKATNHDEMLKADIIQSEKDKKVIKLLQEARKLLIEGFDIKLDDSVSNSNLHVRVYTKSFPDSFGDDSCKLLLLDLRNNNINELSPSNNFSVYNKTVSNDSLLFQSLKDVVYTDTYYPPQFIPESGQKLAPEERAPIRTQRLSEYGKKNQFVTEYAYQQFEIACEHKIFFAVFDALLCLCWDEEKQLYLDRNKKKFKKNILAFLKGYVSFVEKNTKEPCITGLKRLAREFLFDWRIIKKDIENSDSQQLKDIYQEIINN